MPAGVGVRSGMARVSEPSAPLAIAGIDPERELGLLDLDEAIDERVAVRVHSSGIQRIVGTIGAILLPSDDRERDERERDRRVVRAPARIGEVERFGGGADRETE